MVPKGSCNSAFHPIQGGRGYNGNCLCPLHTRIFFIVEKNIGEPQQGCISLAAPPVAEQGSGDRTVWDLPYCCDSCDFSHREFHLLWWYPCPQGEKVTFSPICGFILTVTTKANCLQGKVVTRMFSALSSFFYLKLIAVPFFLLLSLYNHENPASPITSLKRTTSKYSETENPQFDDSSQSYPMYRICL